MAEYLETYVHESRIGVMVQLRCGDDRTQRSEVFVNTARDVAIQIATMNPKAVCAASLNPRVRNEAIASQKTRFLALAHEARLREIEHINRQINVTHCLLEQPFIKAPGLTMSELLSRVSAQLGDRVEVVRFVRWVVGG